MTLTFENIIEGLIFMRRGLFRMGSNELVEMSGCESIEIDVAKMFWKSFSLSPPIESELFSPDIGQRRRTAPPGRKLVFPVCLVKHKQNCPTSKKIC